MKPIALWLLTGFVAILLLANCNFQDPLGATTREQIRTDSAVRIAELESNAQIESARSQKESRTATTQAWTQTLPTLLLIVVGGVLMGIVLYFQGRAYLIQIECASSQPNTTLLSSLRRKLSAYTQRTGQQLEVVNGVYYLSDPQSGKRWRALPKRP